MDKRPIQTRQRALGLSALAVAAAGGTAWLMYTVIQTYEDEVAAARAASPVTRVVVASQDILADRPITAEQLRLADRVLPEGEVGLYYTSLEEVIGEDTNTTVLSGEALRLERLALRQRSSVAAVILAEGARAVTIKVDREAGVGGLLLPGDRVDIIVTIRPDSNELRADWVTETILQSLRVLAVGEDVLGQEPVVEEEEDGKGRARAPRRSVLVTVEVLPDEAEKLALAASRGDLHLTLRAKHDEALLLQRGPLVTNALVGLTQPGAKPRARPKPRSPKETAEVISGRDRTVEEFDEDGNMQRKR